MGDVTLTGARLTVAGLRGDSGKTLVALGLVRAAVEDGRARAQLEALAWRPAPEGAA